MPDAPHVPTRVVGIVAGGGSLPREVAEHVKAAGGSVHIVAIAGEGGVEHGEFPVTTVGWAQFGALLRALRNAGTTEVVIAGSVRRPDLSALRPDIGFFMNIPAVLRIVASGGDDGVLTGVVRFFESKGFKVVSPAAVAPQLVVAEGPFAGPAPPPEAMADVARGFDVIRTLGPFDVGQAVVVSGGQVVVIEGAENTDAMLTRLAMMRRAVGSERRGGVLVKRPKPGQEMRVDMPAIGPGTIDTAVAAGLAGIAVLADGAIALQRPELQRRAAEKGIFVLGAADNGAAIAGMPPAVSNTATISVGAQRPSARQSSDAAHGAELLAALAPFHASGGCVVDRGHVLAIECGEGVAALLARAGGLRQWGKRRWARRSAVAIATEAVAADMTSVLSAAASAGMAGVAVVGRTPQELAHAADTAKRFGLFLIAVSRQGSQS